MTTFANYIIIYCSQNPEECDGPINWPLLIGIVALIVALVAFKLWADRPR